ncbi:protein trichome birefringence-like 2 isoform X2 [Wolffia australiana]
MRTEIKKLPPLEALFSMLFSKRRAISGIGIVLFASFLIFTVLYVGNDEGAVRVDSSASLLLWIFSVDPEVRSLDQRQGEIQISEPSLDSNYAKRIVPGKSSVDESQSNDFGDIAPVEDLDDRSSSGDEEQMKLKMSEGLISECDIFDGRWVRDETKPLYPPGSCPFIDPDFNCHENGRPDQDFLRWRWQPNACEIPSMNALDFLRRLRDQRLIFVGDSLNRNMWESLVCILRHSVKNKTSVYEMSGRRQFKTSGYYSFKFKDYNCSVDFVRSPFLVREVFNGSQPGSESDRLRLDIMDETTAAYRTADIVVFNTGHWWTHEKTSRGVNYYQEGNQVYEVLDVMEAYKKALLTWAKWIDENIDPQKTQIVFRGYSLTHFSGGQWNSGGQCDRETEPIRNESFTREQPEKMKILEEVLRRMKTPVLYLNVTRLTDYRKDAHPSVYRTPQSTPPVNPSVKPQSNPSVKPQDCSHWCLPGVPDSWNELLYASLLRSMQLF